MRGGVGASRPVPGRALLLLAVGAVLTGSAGVAACQAEPPGDFGRPTAVAPAPSVPTVSTQDGSMPGMDKVDAPTRLTVPALKLKATVNAVGVDADTGDFAVPPSVDAVGWYRYGPGFSATAGSIVVAGHVDSAAEGQGAFFRLGSLEAGDEVTLTGPDGRSRAFRVTSRERYRKTAIPLERYFAREGPVRLTLITCGGPFDSRTRHYRDNVVVTAVPRT
ncbi:Sortase family protein [Asanoa hainanensis]|uniref:Sortase family protein n=1 Tax=Asanoa hainanensis TaxID=560556 RepID=A0A239N3V5_9ACTN|nr:class F sortase [Asanoa hainanensis]SNT49430.1 Sortase family protein [Asanoa hainanensis]